MVSQSRDALRVFAGVALVYISLSPFSIAPMGYAAEEIAACRQVLAGSPVAWTRHGGVGLVFQCPFVALGRWIPGGNERWEERLFSVQPALATALLVSLTFAWCSRLSGDAGFALWLALGTAFGTMLWPYAYIGLETTQSLFLLLAGFLALSRSTATWPRSLAFALSAAVAVSTKSNGAMLIPAVAFAGFELFRDRGGRVAPARGAKIAVTVALVGAVFAGNALLRARFWRPLGGFAATVAGWTVSDPVAALLHVVGFIGSPNKGLVVFAPLAVLALFLVPRAEAVDRGVAVFATLAFLGLAAGSSLLDIWTDETWGPRYLHAAIAPLALCLAAASRAGGGRWRTAVPTLCAVGLVVSLLGVLFPYGAVARAAVAAAPVDLETLQGNPRWNQVRFNARLLGLWIAAETGNARDPAWIAPGHPWNFRDPVVGPEERAVDIRTFAVPQPLLLRPPGPTVLARIARPACAALLLGGVALLWSVRRRARSA